MAMYVVIGHVNTGSGSLTYPEDFDVVGYCATRAEAAAACDRLNALEREQNGYAPEPEAGEDDEFNDYDDDEFDGMVYEYEVIQPLASDKRLRK
jgi:hypothetical protein